MIDFNAMARLLAFMAVYDNRKGGEVDVEAWLAVAQMHRWREDVVRRIVIEHYGSGAGTARLTPAMVTDRCRALRAAAAGTFEAPVIPDELPAGLTYPEWFRRQRDEHVDAELTRWAETGQEPQALPPAPARFADVRQLAAAAPPEAGDALRQAARVVDGRRP